jgi:hypothetical protein
MRSGINLDRVYPISLLRLFLPQPSEFVSVPDFDKVYLQWWMSNCLKKIPTSRFQYDTIVGKSGFGMGCCGGSFRFDEFQKAAFSTNSASAPPPLLINSFDLASLVQLASSLLVSENGNEILNSKWVCKSPFGIQKPGVPFGITDKTVPAVSWPKGLNNPYFSGEGERATETCDKALANIDHADGAMPFESEVIKIKPANARSWIEAAFSENRTCVIDWACAVPREPNKLEFEYGSRDRKTFAQDHMVENIAEKEPNLSNYNEANPLSNGACCKLGA